MKAILSGQDEEGLADALEAEGVEVTRIEDVVTAAALDEAGIDEADLFVLTDLDDATAIPVAKDVNPDVRVVVYSHDSLPEFVTGLEVLAVDPDLLGPDVVAEELV